MGKSLTLIGTALTLAITANVSVAQSSKSPVAQSIGSSASSPTEIKLSPEGFKILCERFPLNSRCAGGQAVTPNNSGSTTVETQPSETISTPESTIVPESNPTESTTPAPENTTLPASNPAESTTPAPESTTLPASNPVESTTPAPATISPNQLPNSGVPVIPSIGQ
ncbi:hypothetical protein Nos7524_2923 [Nostoc sp. PCC 7524]|uniref:hypothetical protein n=1 Tax=Nostoc sp. (strain ATCC 29411 / PCC 7524) TaxID=28072 RepID=UPI00029F080E|nr:hypothetical protein [Nostoc sp. PCC 7524]AFY48737.1 hypothetical protein Nos7524_2923 [Nostoc sp. PCC 7524]